MMIRYEFAPDKAVQAAAYLLRGLGGRCDKVKLMKLLYLADREHFLRYGRPITGDAQWVLPHGPLPSRTLNMLAGLEEEASDFALAHIDSDRDNIG